MYPRALAARMASRPGRIHHGLDLAWLEAQGSQDPVSHAYGLWDALREPERTRFVRWDGEDGSRSYLIIWYGGPERPGRALGRPGHRGDLDLASEIPAATQVAVVPERAAWAVLKQRRASDIEPLLALAREPGPPGEAPRRADVRRLDADDAVEVGEFVRRFPVGSPVPYARLDLSCETCLGRVRGGPIGGPRPGAVRFRALGHRRGVRGSERATARPRPRPHEIGDLGGRLRRRDAALFVRESNTGAGTSTLRSAFGRSTARSGSTSLRGLPPRQSPSRGRYRSPEGA